MDGSTEAALAALWSGAAMVMLLAAAAFSIAEALFNAAQFVCIGVEEMPCHVAIRFPGSVVGPVCTFAPLAVEASMTAVSSSPTAAAVSMLLLAILIGSAMVAFVVAIARPAARFPVRKRIAVEVPKSCLPVEWIQRAAAGDEEWEADPAEVDGRDFHHTREVIYGDCVLARRWYLAVDVALGLLASLVSGVHSQIAAVCWGTRSASLLIAVIGVILPLVLRPHLKLLDRVLSFVVGAASVVVAILGMANQGDAGEALAAAAVIVVALRLGAALLLSVIRFIRRRCCANRDAAQPVAPLLNVPAQAIAQPVADNLDALLGGERGGEIDDVPMRQLAALADPAAIQPRRIVIDDSDDGSDDEAPNDRPANERLAMRPQDEMARRREELAAVIRGDMLEL